MQKALLAAAAFVIGAAIGMGLLVTAIVVFGFVHMRNSQSGIGAIAGGISHLTVLLIPVVTGGLAAWWAVRRLGRAQG
jgi:hypothetical protein